MEEKSKQLRIALSFEGAEGTIEIPDPEKVQVVTPKRGKRRPVKPKPTQSITDPRPYHTDPQGPSHSTRIHDLEDDIRTIYGYICEYEEQQRDSPRPEERQTARKAILKKWQDISECMEEYVPLCQSFGYSPPPDLAQLEASCRLKTLMRTEP